MWIKYFFCQIHGFQLVSLLVLFFSIVHFYFIPKSEKKKKREREKSHLHGKLQKRKRSYNGQRAVSSINGVQKPRQPHLKE